MQGQPAAPTGRSTGTLRGPPPLLSDSTKGVKGNSRNGAEMEAELSTSGTSASGGLSPHRLYISTSGHLSAENAWIFVNLHLPID